jgi:multidrug efflux pump subunit AcrA (membrane-fusion protein)
MRLATETEFSRPGTVNFVDNRVNATTGTVRMRGIFPNREGSLKPGLFARIRLPIGQPYDALLIPDEALLSDQGKSYVYVVNSEEKVEYRPVKIGQGIQGLRVIKPPPSVSPPDAGGRKSGGEVKEGLSNGERVIVSGMQRVKRGSEVKATMQAPPKPPESPLSRLLTQLPSIRPGDTESRRPGDRETRRSGDSLSP